MPRFDWLWLFFWGSLSTACCLSAAPQLSATFDEPFYVRAGVESWRSGSNFELMRAGTMPLPVDVQCLPVYLGEQFRGNPFDLANDFPRLLPWCRAMNLVFWWTLLVYSFLLARLVSGTWAGRFATILVATEPNLLAHACLATTDISVAALVLAFVYHFQVGRAGNRWRRWVLPGVLFGLALSAKVSAVMFVPLILAAFEIARVARTETWAGSITQRAMQLCRASWPAHADAWKVFFVGMVFVFVYCGTDWKPQPKWVENAATIGERSIWADPAQFVTRNLAVFPNASEAFHFQFKHNVKGHGSAVLGEWHRRAVWYYFPVALAIKLSLPVLSLCAGLWVFRPRSMATSLGLATLFLLLFSLNCRVQIGIRLVFPVVVVLLLALAVGGASATAGWSSRSRLKLLAAGAVMFSLPAVMAWPDGLRYSNQLWGGPARTHIHLAESNSDWGQGLCELERWLAAHNVPEARIWYYGADPTVFRQDRMLPLHVHYDYPVQAPADTWQWVRGKVIAVSANLLYGNRFVTPTMPVVVEFFLAQQPIGVTGTFYVFDFRDKQ